MLLLSLAKKKRWRNISRKAGSPIVISHYLLVSQILYLTKTYLGSRIAVCVIAVPSFLGLITQALAHFAATFHVA